MYQVTVTGKSLNDLYKGCEKVLSEISGGEFVAGSKTNITSNVDLSLLHRTGGAEETNDETEDVPSPFSTSTPSLAGELDAEGIPWNSAVHSSSKKTVKNGTWKVARGVDDAQVAAYKASIRSGQSMTTTPAPAANVTTPAATPPATAPAATAPTTMPGPAMPAMSTGHTLQSFSQNFAMVIGSLITAGKITQEYVNQLKGHFGLGEIWQASEEQKATMFEHWAGAGIIQKVG